MVGRIYHIPWKLVKCATYSAQFPPSASVHLEKDIFKFTTKCPQKKGYKISGLFPVK